MIRWILGRLLQAAATLVVVVLLLFILMRLAPGDPLARLVGDRDLAPGELELLRARYGVDRPAFYDRDLRRLFSDDPALARHPTAAAFIARHRREIRRMTSRWTNEYQYTIDRVIDDMVQRSRQLGLRLAMPAEQTKLEFAVLLAVQTMNYLHSGRHRVAL